MDLLSADNVRCKAFTNHAHVPVSAAAPLPRRATDTAGPPGDILLSGAQLRPRVLPAQGLHKHREDVRVHPPQLHRRQMRR